VIGKLGIVDEFNRVTLQQLNAKWVGRRRGREMGRGEGNSELNKGEICVLALASYTDK